MLALLLLFVATDMHITMRTVKATSNHNREDSTLSGNARNKETHAKEQPYPHR